MFDLPKENNSIIKVIGVGGGGSNAVNHMFKQGIKGVDFVVCNTDKQALDISPIPLKLSLGESLTQGLGAGSLPEVGKNAAIETIEDIKKILSNNTKMVFITAGMGGGTGTGAAPIIAQTAKDMGILTVGIVTLPFVFEGKKRKTQAELGIEEMRKSVDTLLIINNDKLRELYGNLKVREAFSQADDVLTTAAKGIADIITTTLHINTDFADIVTVMKDSGVAIMGSSQASGENRAIKAVEQALSSPLLNDSNITGARYILLNITCGTEEITMDELGEITDYVQDAAGQTAEVIKGYGIDETLGDNISITIIATGFQTNMDLGYEFSRKVERKVLNLTDETQTQAKIEEPVVAEQKLESVEENVLEPFLINRTTEVEKTPEVEVVAEVEKVEEIQMIVQEEVIEEVVAEPTPEVIEMQQVEVISEEKVEEIQMIVQEEEIIEEQPIVAETPKVIEFEITNISAIESVKEEEPVAKTEITESYIDTLSRQQEEIAATVNEPVMEVPKAIEPTMTKADEEAQMQKIEHEEQMRKAKERIMRLKELSLKIKTPNGLNELENEPAYKRKNVSLDDVAHSSESNISRFSLTENEDKKVEIRPNNSFLHDNVD